MFRRRNIGFLLLSLFLEACKNQSPSSPKTEFQNADQGLSIESITHQGNTWRVVTIDPKKSKPSIRLSDSAGKPLRDFSAFEEAAQKANEEIIWMMNAGMYHNDGSPVGLCICDGQEISPINQSAGTGNFFLMPNGIFYLTEQGAQIIETSEWDPKIKPSVLCATQSGPLLVQRGKLHPAIRPNSPNKHIRNGVGIRQDGQLCFIISANKVSFHEMALFLRDHLHCPNALYLDGAVSALYAPKANLKSQAKGLGPIIGHWD